MSMARWLAIGADGGGTHVRFRACLVGGPDDGETEEIESEGVNAANDPAAAARCLAAGTAELRRRLDVPGGVPVALFAGLAGAMDRGLAEGVRQRLDVARARVEDDRGIAVQGALDFRDGTLVGLGTGSFAGRLRGGELRLLGGWGFRVADQASGAWLGRRLLERVVLHADGVAQGGATVREALAAFGSALAVSKFAIHAGPAEFARYAPAVADGAEANEADMRAIMHEGAAYVVAALGALGWREGETLCLVGGVAARYRPHLPDAVREALAPARGTSLDAALARAVAMARDGGGA